MIAGQPSRLKQADLKAHKKFAGYCHSIIKALLETRFENVTGRLKKGLKR